MKKLFLILATLLALAVNPAFAQKSNGGSVSGSLTAADSGTCSGSTSCVWMTFPAYQFPFNTTITVSGTWAGTLSIQGNNGGIWTTIGTTTSNETVTTWATQYTDIRVLETAYTSGTAVVKISREAITPGESSGQIVFSSATSGTHTFTQPYNTAPVCVAVLDGTTPDSTADSVAASATATVLTITTHTSNSQTWDWHCFPAVN